MRLLSLDQSSRTSGYAIFEDSKLVQCGTFTFDDDDFGIRLLKIRARIYSLIQEYKIDKVAFEDIQMQDNVMTFKKLAEVYGVVQELLTEIKMPYEIVLAATWKSTLKIKGSKRDEQKHNAKEWVISTYGIKPSQDACDAICIGAHLVRSAPDHDWSK